MKLEAIKCTIINEKEKIECNGGQGCCVYRIKDTTPYFDKGGHKERSLYNAPQHREHWKKVAVLPATNNDV